MRKKNYKYKENKQYTYYLICSIWKRERDRKKKIILFLINVIWKDKNIVENRQKQQQEHDK